MPLEWRAVPCEGCSRSTVTIEVRRSARLNGAPGQHLVTRVRNLHAFPVVVDVVFSSPTEDPGAESYTSTELHRLVLRAAGEPECERLVAPKLDRIVAVAIVSVERL